MWVFSLIYSLNWLIYKFSFKLDDYPNINIDDSFFQTLNLTVINMFIKYNKNDINEYKNSLIEIIEVFKLKIKLKSYNKKNEMFNLIEKMNEKRNFTEGYTNILYKYYSGNKNEKNTKKLNQDNKNE